ncbi:MAG: CinA family protein [Agromyces sp.]
MSESRIHAVAAELVRIAIARNASLAVAESLTGGWVASTLVAVPGTSEVFRGGIVSYQTQVKRSVLGVDGDLLAEAGPVDSQVAAQMAEHVRDLFAVDGSPAVVGMSTTGVAGPTEQDGHPVGEVFVAVATASLSRVERFMFEGSRDDVREQAVAAVLELALEVIQEMSVVTE